MVMGVSPLEHRRDVEPVALGWSRRMLEWFGHSRVKNRGNTIHQSDQK